MIYLIMLLGVPGLIAVIVILVLRNWETEMTMRRAKRRQYIPPIALEPPSQGRRIEWD
jgi:hypothetical protein